MRIAVIGGGITGLALTHRLLELKKQSKKNFEINLLEAAPRLGGIIESRSCDGFLLESGPDSFISEKPWALDLARRLGLSSEVIGTRRENRRSFVLRQGKLLAVPEGFYLISPTRLRPFLESPVFSLSGKLRILAEALLPRRAGENDETVGSFVRRRFGREAFDRVGQAMLGGIYTGDPDKLSLSATMPRFRELEKKYGSLIRGLAAEKAGPARRHVDEASGPRYSLFVSLRRGMEDLVKALAGQIPPDDVKLNFRVKEISYDIRTSQWRVLSQSGQMRVFDKVCLTLPARHAAALLRNNVQRLSFKLSQIRYESVLTVNLAYKREQIPHPLDGFGFVTPKIENRPTIACTFCDRKFEGRAPQGFSLLRAFVGGAFGKKFFEKTDEEITKRVTTDLKELLGVKGEPLFLVLKRYPDSMVQYGLGHPDWVSEIRKIIPKNLGLYLAGSAYSGVGIPDCVRDAEAEAGEIFKSL